MTNPDRPDSDTTLASTRGQDELNDKTRADAMGGVYVVTQKRGSIRHVTGIRRLHDALTLSEDDRKQLLAEARIAFELCHPRRRP